MMKQTVFPEKRIFFAGENITFRLENVPSSPGEAVIRTNLGRAEVHFRENIAETEKGTPVSGMDWHDIPMYKKSASVWEISLPLTEVGVFEAKCCFVPADGSRIKWPREENFRFKTEPAGTACGNSIYSAFIRQFGPDLYLENSRKIPPHVKELDDAGYTVIPPSGTFRNVISQLDHIFYDLRCRILQLLPIHPVPVQYGRMGRYGSPFAALDYFNVDPALADFDEKATPMEQFGELIDAVHARDGMIFMDIPVNHTGWASKLQIEHPDYFVRKADGTFESPGAWGIVWADLCKLNYKEPKVHELMAKVFLFWCRRGVDGFRCDAGYMLPAEAWEYITSRVRLEYPETVFLLEGLGGPLEKQEILLSEKGLNWGYSELFQNYSRDEISRYQPYMNQISTRCGTLVSFAETHDNLRLAANGKTYAKLRFLVCSLLSEGGAFGFANGAEFFASEKIDVHGSGALNFGSQENLVELIGKINRLLAVHPAFFPEAKIQLVQTGGGNVIAALRENQEQKLLILLNLNCSSTETVHWHSRWSPAEGRDLLTGKKMVFSVENDTYFTLLAPGEGMCIGFTGSFETCSETGEPQRILEMRANLMAEKAVVHLTGSIAASSGCSGKELLVSPRDFVVKYAGKTLPPLVIWSPQNGDPRREVMLAPGDLLWVKDMCPFTCRILDQDMCISQCKALPGNDGSFFALTGLPENTSNIERKVNICICRFPETGKAEHLSGVLVLLPCGEKRKIAFSFKDVEKNQQLVFCSNKTGSYAMFPAAWGEIHSKYEAILALNTDPRYPVDRRVLFSNMRAWLVTNDYSQEITSCFLTDFSASKDNAVRWTFMLPAGQGCRIALETTFSMAENGHAVRFKFQRKHHRQGAETTAAAKLILRPAVEDRINHEVTKAFMGPEQDFPRSVAVFKDGFDFDRQACTLSLRSSRGRFVSEPEWYYMCPLPKEAYYGLEAATDRFSPGYFEITLPPEGEVTLSAGAVLGGQEQSRLKWPEPVFTDHLKPEDFVLNSLARFVVKRDALSTVLAGYPWFLDWGRDTLIVLRGLVKAAVFQPEAVKIIRAFAAFERAGTIPNVIRGEHEANRDTSDAPLYLIVAVRDYIAASGNSMILQQDCGGRTLEEVLKSIVNHYMTGTPNGIRMDEKSKLIFSPSHFSWMDTNFPAGTPRCGYPIEIQALWYAGLSFLGYEDMARQVSGSIEKFFFSRKKHCSDCLHCGSFVPADQALPDDHNRSNQLLAVTLGAVKDPDKIQSILDDAALLLVPGGIRTLADTDVSFQLPVFHNDQLLNDPRHPYRGRYCGPEDTERKAAYHNGTVWCWPFPAYCEALFMAGKGEVRERALALLMSASKFFEMGATGELPEVADGDAPHIPGGCPAQAWSISEFYRVYELLKISH